ncbi:MAG: hypothetical protein HKN70_03655 [Gammaproteobacteria bacterium]|nr:hypothetical protein [Gammaproteobacteria bacterium]
MIKFTLSLMLLGMYVATVACSGQAPESAPDSASMPGRQPVKIAPVEVDKQMTKAPVNGGVPDALLEELRNKVVQESGIDKAQIVTVRADKVTWRNGSLGCPQPNLMYTQALVPGYWVILRAGREEFDYRATEQGNKYMRCRSMTKQAPIIHEDHDS